MQTKTRWNLNSIYPSLNSTELSKDIEILKNSIESFHQKLNTLTINKIKDEEIVDLIKEYEKIIEKNRKIQAFIICVLSVESKNEEAQKIKGHLYNLSSSLKLLDLKLEKIISQTNINTPEYKYFIELSIENNKHRMKDEEEELYSLLSVSSNSEWKSLYNELISNIKVDFENQIISISQLRNYYNHSNREIRKKAYRKEIEIFKEYEYIFSRILNSVKWDSVVISKKRNFSSVLEQSLFYNQIDKEILDVVINTTFENLSMVRKYFHKKAKFLGLEKLDWFDLSAPIFEKEVETFDFEKAQKFILESFAEFSDDMCLMAKEAFENGWIDAEPRIGKADGGFCIYVFDKQSRILVNFDNSIKSVLTLAHELGHAYHNWVMSENTPLFRHSPLILAETASILAETITRKNAIKLAKNQYTKAQILDGYLYTVSIVVVDIMSRFIFEDKVINIRKERTLSPSELCSIMLDSQYEVYVDSINSYHPYMWANKPHYYSSNYYNYPYLCGLLIGLSLYNLFENKKITANDYRDILKNTAKDKPERILKSIGLDIRTKEFWQEAFNRIEKDIQEYLE